jgi:hypothetical protein
MRFSVRTPDELEATALERHIKDAMWSGDVDTLNELAPCKCCCDEHTYGPGCPAYQWGGCRGQGTMTHDDYLAWAEHYKKFHGMTEDEFYGSHDNDY